MASNFEMIRDAIRDKLQVHATYHGHERQMCPHVMGRKNGRLQALFYQFAGSSRKGLSRDGSPANWRCMALDELIGVELVEGPWHTAPNHDARSTCVGQVIAEVDYH